MVWNFIGVYIINGTLHHLEICNFSSHVEKQFSTLDEKFSISAQPCNILYLPKVVMYIQSCKSLSKQDIFRTGTKFLSKRGVCLIEKQIRGVKKGRVSPTDRCPFIEGSIKRVTTWCDYFSFTSVCSQELSEVVSEM